MFDITPPCQVCGKVLHRKLLIIYAHGRCIRQVKREFRDIQSQTNILNKKSNWFYTNGWAKHFVGEYNVVDLPSYSDRTSQSNLITKNTGNP